MTKLNDQTNVCDLVIENSRIATVFDRYQIDYCCGGNITLQEACQEKGIDYSEVWEEIQQINDSNAEEIDLANVSLSDLVEHIVNIHHRYLKEELPAIEQLLERVVHRHGDNYPSLKELQQVYCAFSSEILEHLVKEEDILFPWICQVESDPEAQDSHCGNIQNPIHVMEQEHIAAAGFLEEMRKLTNDYTPPSEACNSFRVLYQKLNDMETDLHRHIHKENHILFPKTLNKGKSQ